MVKTMCESCLAHAEANDVAFDQAVSSAKLRILDYELREKEKIMSSQPMQESSIGNSIGNIQTSIDELYQQIESLDAALEKVSRTEKTPKTEADSKAESPVKYIGDLEGINSRIMTAISELIDIRDRLRL